MDPRFRLVVFDFDGTLANSFGWFVSVLDEVAQRYRLRRIGLDEVESLRSLGTREVLSALAVPRWKLPFIARHMRGLKRESLAEIDLFPGVDVLLDRIGRAGITRAIVSSDTEANIRQVLGPENERRIDLYDCGASLFGKRAHIARVMRTANVRPDQTLCIGDESRDSEAARAAGAAFGAVSWGYADPSALSRGKPDVLFESLEEIGDVCLARTKEARNPARPEPPGALGLQAV